MKLWRLPLSLLLVLGVLAASFAQTGDQVVKKETAELAKLEKAYNTAKAAHVKKPADAKLKKTYVTATVDYGHAVMVSPALPPRMKYPQALKLFREAKKADPKNEKATKWITTIEEIYKSMGKPVPKG